MLFRSVLLFGNNLFESDEAKVKTAVAEKLRDPDSAEFRDIKVGETIACGEVNGKNGFGAYSGFSKFVYADGVVLMEPTEPVRFNVADQTIFYEKQTQFFRLMQRCLSQEPPPHTVSGPSRSSPADKPLPHRRSPDSL